MSVKINQKEYLKKYLSGDKTKKKKTKKLKAKAMVKIIDDDMHANNGLEIDEELLLTGEDAPQIVGIIEASGEAAESKWKSIGSIKKEEKSDDDLWGKKSDTKRIKSPVHMEELLFKRAKPPPAQTNSNYSLSRSKPVNRQNFNTLDLYEKSSKKNLHTSAQDQSPRKKHSPTRLRRDLDQSPPKKRSPTRLRKNSDESQLRKRSPTRIRKDSDQSPPRKRSPTRIKRDSDQSPPRKRSPTRIKRDSDQSPPRKRSPTRLKRNSDQSPPRNRSPNRLRRDSDQSPPRRVNPEQLPPRQGRSPHRKIKNSDFSRGRHSDQPTTADLYSGSSSPPPTHKSSSSKMSKTLDGKRAGLQNAQALRIETEERRRNEDKMFKEMSKEMTGRNAEVQVRKSSYQRHRKHVEEDPEVQRKKAEHEEKKKVLYSRWNKGVKQIEELQAKISDDKYEGSKPLARYSNDADLDEMLRQRERDDDPMLEYMRSKKKDQQQASNIPVMPKYQGSYPENRFNIPPGYRWDGVDRSNGYENKWFNVQSLKQAAAEEAYKYSVEDM